MRELPENTEMIVQELTSRRQQVEMRIEMHRDSACQSLLEVGRQLNIAKDENLIPHGQWVAWVERHAFMNERTAQKWMQAARELPPGSPLERLGIAKIQSLMTLPAAEREEFAQKIDAQNLSSREVDAAVKAARAERDEALRVVGEQKKRIREMAQDKDKLITDAIARTRVDVTREKESEIRRLESLVKSADIGRKHTEVLLDQAREQLETAKVHAHQLQQDLEQEKMRKAAPDPAQLLEIHKLQETIAKKEREIDRLSDQLDEAQTAAMRGGMTGGEKTSPATMILSAIGGLMGQAGRAPGELARMQGMDAETREILCGQARLVGQWAMQILAACGEGDGHV
ncbi:MAG: DUF3102 domain-containing protein [Clostridia bacterium]|nr:DUF3102 domain-containing protein [Clostridia bacterium]